MKALLKIFFIFACIILPFSSAFAKASDHQAKILKDLDIDASFVYTSYFQDMKNSIKDGQIQDFKRTLSGGYKYIGALRNTIKASGIPDTFFYLAMVESGFSNKAVSHAKAAGIWQFMVKTAQSHGLRVDKYVDERLDPIKATKAAMTYLKGLKSQFGKWYLAIMAYNCGDGRLRRGISMAGTDDLATLLNPNKNYIPAETRRFVMKIIRASFIAKDAEFALSKDAGLLNANGVKLSAVSIPGGTSLKQISDSIGVSLKKLKDDNMHLNYAFTPPNFKTYHIYIPDNKKSVFAENFKPIKSQNRFYFYTVKKGDTLFGIAKNSGVSHRAIKEYNELKSNTIAINQKLVIPRSNVNKFQNYIVQNGDTLEILSKKFNVAKKDIKEANALASSDVLVTGANIVIP